MESSATSYDDPVIGLDDCRRRYEQANKALIHRFNRKIALYDYQVHYLSQTIFKLESEIFQCKSKLDERFNYHSTSDFVNDQLYGLLVGFAGLIVYFVDHRCGNYYAKRNNVKLKFLARHFFPTLLCFVQIQLRKRNKNSRLAAFLSDIKKDKNTNFDGTVSPPPCCSHCNLAKQPRPKCPRPFSPRLSLQNLNSAAKELKIRSNSVRYCVPPPRNNECGATIVDISESRSESLNGIHSIASKV